MAGMARNVEIKARIPAVVALVPIAAGLSDRGPTVIEQDDTFYACPNGRLKLREEAAGGAELIFYQRADERGPKESFYLRTPVADAEAMRTVLGAAHGETGRVRKRRVLFRVGRTRIHLDSVQGLGEFLELEAVLRDGEGVETGMAEAQSLLERLGVSPDQLLSDAYVDQLRAAPRTSARLPP